MARTIRDIPVYGRSELDVVNAIMGWAQARGGYVVGGAPNDPRGTHLVVQMGVGVWQARRLFEVTLRPAQGGLLVHTEGYATAFASGEMDLSPNAVNAGLPRRQGWQEMNDLWGYIGQLSVAGPTAYATGPVAAPVAAVPPVRQTGTVYCMQCGGPLPASAKFCNRCGARATP